MSKYVFLILEEQNKNSFCKKITFESISFFNTHAPLSFVNNLLFYISLKYGLCPRNNKK